MWKSRASECIAVAQLPAAVPRQPWSSTSVAAPGGPSNSCTTNRRSVHGVDAGDVVGEWTPTTRRGRRIARYAPFGSTDDDGVADGRERLHDGELGASSSTSDQ